MFHLSVQILKNIIRQSRLCAFYRMVQIISLISWYHWRGPDWDICTVLSANRPDSSWPSKKTNFFLLWSWCSSWDSSHQTTINRSFTWPRTTNLNPSIIKPNLKWYCKRISFIASVKSREHTASLSFVDHEYDSQQSCLNTHSKHSMLCADKAGVWIQLTYKGRLQPGTTICEQFTLVSVSFLLST